MKYSLLIFTLIVVTLILSSKCDMVSDLNSMLNSISYSEVTEMCNQNLRRLNEMLPILKKLKLPDALVKSNVDYEEILEEVSINSPIKEINSNLKKHASKINELDQKIDQLFEYRNAKANIEQEANQTVNELTNYTNSFISSIGPKTLDMNSYFNLYKLKDILDGKIYEFFLKKPITNMENKKYIFVNYRRLLGVYE